jgi:hypothetical protein
MIRHNIFVKIAFLLFVYVCFTRPNSAQEQLDSLQFQIQIEKDTFLVSEPIWLDLYLENTDTVRIEEKPLWIGLGGGWLEFILVNSKGDTLRPYAREVIDFVGPGPTYTLEPNESQHVCLDLLEGTGLGEREKWMSGRSYLKTDTYRVEAIYKGYLESNQITFNVANPTGEEKIALQLWREGYADQIKKRADKSFEKWRELVERYPKSVYAPSAFNELCYWSKDPKDIEKHGKELLLKYSNSRFVRNVFWKLLQDKPRNEQVQFLKDVLKKIPADTRAADWAKESLKALEEQEGKEK